MLSESIQAALNQQIANEFYAAHLYLSMTAYFEHRNLKGFAHWMRLQQQEETSHAMRLFDFVIHNRGRVTLKGVEQPPSDFKGPLAVMERALEHEQQVTREIHELYEQAVKEKQYSTQLEMQWFIAEQVEEEAAVDEIVGRLKLASDDPSALLLIDRELATRTLPG